MSFEELRVSVHVACGMQADLFRQACEELHLELAGIPAARNQAPCDICYVVPLEDALHIANPDTTQGHMYESFSETRRGHSSHRLVVQRECGHIENEQESGQNKTNWCAT